VLCAILKKMKIVRISEAITLESGDQERDRTALECPSSLRTRLPLQTRTCG
jgi:hypothetical protein